VCDFGCPIEWVHLVGVSISFEKNFYLLPFTPPSLVAYRSFTFKSGCDTWHEAVAAAMYSASQLERDTTFFLTDC
jgi:hypothetical protein